MSVLFGEDDLANPAVNASALWATGHVVGGAGKATFAGHLKTVRPSGQVLFGPGLTNAMGAEINLLARTHRQALTGQDLIAHLTTVGGGCDVNVCEDTQFTIFVP